MAEVEKFTLRLKMEATITVNDATGEARDWIKPGTEVGCTWNGEPTEAQIMEQYESLSNVAAATLGAVIVQSQNQIDNARRG